MCLLIIHHIECKSYIKYLLVGIHIDACCSNLKLHCEPQIQQAAVLVLYQSIPKPPIPPPRANQKIWFNSPLSCRFGRSNAPPVGPSKRFKSRPPPSSHAKVTVQNFFPCIKPCIQMYIFCNKQIANVWMNNRPEQKNCGHFKAYIFLWKKNHQTNNNVNKNDRQKEEKF